MTHHMMPRRHRRLLDPDKRPPSAAADAGRLSDQVKPCPAQLNWKKPCGRLSVAGLQACPVQWWSMEYCTLLENDEALDLLANRYIFWRMLTRRPLCCKPSRCHALSRSTALSKPGGGIATGDTLPRLVSQTLARQYTEGLEL